MQPIPELRRRPRHPPSPELRLVACTGRPPVCMGSRYALRDLLPPRVSVRTLPSFVRRFPNASYSRHLLGTGRREEALTVVAKLNGVPENDPLVETTVSELEYGIRAENEGGKATWAECFSTRNALWKRTVNGMMLQFIQQLNGQNFYCKQPSNLPQRESRLTTPFRLLRRYILPECWNPVSRLLCLLSSPSDQSPVFLPTLSRLSWEEFP
jgi:hypothetical protein